MNQSIGVGKGNGEQTFFSIKSSLSQFQAESDEEEEEGEKKKEEEENRSMVILCSEGTSNHHHATNGNSEPILFLVFILLVRQKVLESYRRISGIFCQVFEI